MTGVLPVWRCSAPSRWEDPCGNTPYLCVPLVGLPDVDVLGIDDRAGDELLRVHIEARSQRPECPRCDGVVWHKDRDRVVLVDLPQRLDGRRGCCGTSNAGYAPTMRVRPGRSRSRHHGSLPPGA